MQKLRWFLALSALLLPTLLWSQQRLLLESGWRCRRTDEVRASGEQVSRTSFDLSLWMPVKVPGTVLATLIQNRKVPDPMFGMNNKQIPDIYASGRSGIRIGLSGTSTQAL